MIEKPDNFQFDPVSFYLGAWWTRPTEEDDKKNSVKRVFFNQVFGGLSRNFALISLDSACNGRMGEPGSPSKITEEKVGELFAQARAEWVETHPWDVES